MSLCGSMGKNRYVFPWDHLFYACINCNIYFTLPFKKVPSKRGYAKDKNSKNGV